MYMYMIYTSIQAPKSLLLVHMMPVFIALILTIPTGDTCSISDVKDVSIHVHVQVVILSQNAAAIQSSGKATL